QVETIALPTDLLDAAGAASLDNPLTVLVTRQRQDPTDVTRLDEEERITRLVSLPTARSFRLDGEARLYRRDRAAVIDELLGRPHDGSVTWARSSARLTGDVHTAAAAFDGDPGTAWTTVRAEPVGQWVEVVLTEPVTVDRLPVTLLADGYHSVPTALEVWVDGEVVGRVPVPPVEDGDRQGATAEVELELPEPVTGSRVRLRVTQVREVLTNDWVSDREVAQPVAIAEIGLPADPVPALPEGIDTGRRTDLVASAGERGRDRRRGGGPGGGPAGGHRRARPAGRPGAGAARGHRHRLPHRPRGDRRRAGARPHHRPHGRRPGRARAAAHDVRRRAGGAVGR